MTFLYETHHGPSCLLCSAGAGKAHIAHRHWPVGGSCLPAAFSQTMSQGGQCFHWPWMWSMVVTGAQWTWEMLRTCCRGHPTCRHGPHCMASLWQHQQQEDSYVWLLDTLTGARWTLAMTVLITVIQWQSSPSKETGRRPTSRHVSCDYHIPAFFT